MSWAENVCVCGVLLTWWELYVGVWCVTERVGGGGGCVVGDTDRVSGGCACCVVFTWWVSRGCGRVWL